MKHETRTPGEGCALPIAPAEQWQRLTPAEKAAHLGSYAEEVLDYVRYARTHGATEYDIEHFAGLLRANGGLQLQIVAHYLGEQEGVNE